METHWIRVFNWLIFVDLKRTHFAVPTLVLKSSHYDQLFFFFQDNQTVVCSFVHWPIFHRQMKDEPSEYKKDFFFRRMEKKKPHWFWFSFPVTYLVSIHLYIYIQSTLKKKLVWQEVPSNNFNIKRSGTVHIWSIWNIVQNEIFPRCLLFAIPTFHLCPIRFEIW